MEDIEYLLLDNKNNIILSTINDDMRDIIDLIEDRNKLISFQGKEYRTGKIVSENGTLYAYTVDKKFIRNTNLFKTHTNVIVSLLSNLNTFKKEVSKEINKHINILIHNLTTLNAHDMQELFNLVPQEDLAKNPKRGLKTIKEKIEENTTKASQVFLKLLKNNIATKTEFSVFSKLYEENPTLNKKNYVISDVLYNVLYNFFPDLTDKEIEITLNFPTTKAFFDYESIQVALFHMVDNIVKYIKPKSTLVIEFKDFLNEINIVFDMISLKVNEDEKDKIFIEGFSGQCATKNGQSGKGIGMSRVKQILELNNGDISLKTGDRYANNDIEYNNNIFTIILKKENYYR